MISFGSFYHLIPRLYETRLYSNQLVYVHFWLATIGIVLYTVSMWAAGLMEGLQWRAIGDGGLLANRSFGGVQVSRTFYARGQTGQIQT